MKKMFATILLVGTIGMQVTPLASASMTDDNASNSSVQKYYAKHGIQKEVKTSTNTNTVKTSTAKTQEQEATPKVQQVDNTVTKSNTTSTTVQIASFEQQVIDLTNKERVAAGLAPLSMDEPLMANAQAKSKDMQTNAYFSHTSPTLGTPFEQMKARGITYKSAGENIAKGQTTPEQVVKAWMDSPGHKANILNAKYTHIGVGYVANGHYWTQQFIQK